MFSVYLNVNSWKKIQEKGYFRSGAFVNVAGGQLPLTYAPAINRFLN